MTGMERNRLSWLLEHASQAASAVAITVGILVLCGWMFDLTLLKSVFSGLVAMKVNTALGFILAGISLWQASPHGQHPLSRVCAVIVLLLGLLTVGEYLSGQNFGIDELMIPDITSLPGDIHGRMAANTAVSFVALGAALALLSRKEGGFMRTIQMLAIVPILVAGTALVGYGYDIETFFRSKLNYTPMAIHTSVVFVLLGFGVLNARADYSFRRIMTSDSAAGSTARRLWPPAMGLQLVMGWVLLKGVQAGYLSEAVGLALFAVLNIGGLSALIHWNAAQLYQSDAQRQRAEKALKDSEKQYRNLVDNLQEGIWCIDVNTCTAFVNPRMAEMLGYTIDEMLGRHLFEFMDERMKEIAARHIELRRQGIKERYELDFLRKDGTRIQASLEASPLYDDHGNYAGALAGVTDITARKQLEAKLAEASAYTRRLIEASLDPLVTISADGDILDVNEATVNATGVSREDLIGSDFSNYFTEPEKARAGYLEVFAKGFVMDYPLAIRHVSGKTMDVLYNASVYHNEKGEVAGVFAAARDITERKRAEHEVAELKERYQTLFDRSPDAYLLMEIDRGTISDCNQAAETILRGDRQQILGKTPDQLSPPNQPNGKTSQEAAAEKIEESLRDGRNRFEWVHQRLDGTDFWAEVTISTIGIEGRQVLLVAWRDISDKKRAEQALEAERQRFYDVLETLPVMICLMTPDYHVAFANRSFRERFGESGGRPCYEYVWGYPEPCAFCESFKVLETGKPHFWQVTAPDGTVIDAYDFPFTDVDGSPLVLEMDIDVTEQKRAEAEINRLNAELEQRVEARTAELRAANTELYGFAYAVSHHLRAPLRAMSGFSQALTEDYGDRLDDEARGYLDQISLASRNMSDLVDGLLTLSRSTRGELKQEVLNISAMAERLLAEMAAAEPARRVAWTVEPGMQAQGDATMIKIVMRNLIDNAWKYTGKTTNPVIRVYSGETEGQRCFCVSDNGAGFDRAHAGKLFQPFQRLHRQEEFPGIGIGLATVQRIVHRHGGTIWAEGAPDQGATFCFTLHNPRHLDKETS